MRKLLPIALLFVFLVGCSSQNDRNEEQAPSSTNNESSQPAASQTVDPAQFENAVVVYYSLTENTEEVAQEIQEQAEVDIYEIQPVEPYPTSYGEVAGLVREQQENDEFPDLEELDIDLDQYDTIFVGSPTWHGYISQPVQRWLMDTDLEDKNIAPFFTSGSQPIEDPQSDLQELIPNTNISDELSMADSPRDDIEESVNQWLNSLTF
ncbi:flavodoxin [Tetragenococcus muriaticus]|uniref:flavodoxin n=1 Tax=Tetragenococcus muriaticus TaxID=64642 RepID=UPI000412E19D|nr:flavodoxin [Tetragenococcus muriaticus]GMA47575.1 hypothetical protein GCM10025854_18250 [Tetragenococcus muriaticus]